MAEYPKISEIHMNTNNIYTVGEIENRRNREYDGCLWEGDNTHQSNFRTKLAKILNFCVHKDTKLDEAEQARQKQQFSNWFNEKPYLRMINN